MILSPLEQQLRTPQHQNLDLDTISAITALLRNDHLGTQQAAVKTFQYQQDLDLDSIGQSIVPLYQRLMEVSFDEHVYWYFSDKTSHMVFGSKEIRFKDRQDQFQDMLWKGKESIKASIPEIQ